jgi:hypothetical protein
VTEIRKIALNRKEKATKCSEHRTVSLLVHTARLLARIVTRIERRIEDVLGVDQFGFRGGKVTRDAIGMLRMILELTVETGDELCACFIDWQKEHNNADPKINWNQLV